MTVNRLIKYINKYSGTLTPPEIYQLMNSAADYYKKQSQEFIAGKFVPKAQLPPESEIIKSEGPPLTD